MGQDKRQGRVRRRGGGVEGWIHYGVSEETR